MKRYDRPLCRRSPAYHVRVLRTLRSPRPPTRSPPPDLRPRHALNHSSAPPPCPGPPPTPADRLPDRRWPLSSSYRRLSHKRTSEPKAPRYPSEPPDRPLSSRPDPATITILSG